MEAMKVAFKKLPSYTETEDGGYILSSDVLSLASAMNYDRPPDQLKMLMQFYDKYNEGKLPFTVYVDAIAHAHDMRYSAKITATMADTDGNGFISADEYHDMYELLLMHNPKLKAIPFETFLQEADTNKDGLVSIEECLEWLTIQLKSVQ